MQILDAKAKRTRLAEVAKSQKATSTKLETVMDGMRGLSSAPQDIEAEKATEELNMLQNQVFTMQNFKYSIKMVLNSSSQLQHII